MGLLIIMLNQNIVINEIKKDEKKKYIFTKIFYLIEQFFFPDEKTKIFYKFNKLYYNNKFEEAVSLAIDYLRSNPNNDKMKYDLALAYTRLNKYDDALKLANDLVEKNPTNKDFLCIYIFSLPIEKLVIMIETDNYKKFEIITEFYEYSIARLLEKKFIEVAQKLLLKTNQININSWYLHYLSGYIYDLSKIYNKAIEEYRLSLKSATYIYKKLIKQRIKEIQECIFR